MSWQQSRLPPHPVVTCVRASPSARVWAPHNVRSVLQLRKPLLLCLAELLSDGPSPGVKAMTYRSAPPSNLQSTCTPISNQLP